MTSRTGTPDNILTISGRHFSFTQPRKNDIVIEDIAHGLSRLCRFNGQIESFYSVAQHCVLVSTIVPQEYARVGLLHDAAEAYIGDVTRPLKQLLSDYKIIEVEVEQAVLERFGETLPYPDVVTQADRTALMIENFYLRPHHKDEIRSDPSTWLADVPRLVPLGPADAKRLFLDRYAELNP